MKEEIIEKIAEFFGAGATIEDLEEVISECEVFITALKELDSS